MSDMPDTVEHRYRILGQLALAAARGEDPQALLRQALADAVTTVGLAAGAARIFGPEGADLAHAQVGDPAAVRQIEQLEQTLLGQLRKTWSVKSLFMTLDLEAPAGIFSYPLRANDTVIGVITGIAYGERSLAVEEEFVSYLASMMVLIGRGGPAWSQPEAALDAQRLDNVRTEAVIETGAALNHEINNPLMAVLGNVQLLMRKSPSLDPDTLARLTKVQEAAERIRDVTHALVRIKKAKSAPYPGGGRMIDIDGSPKSE
ncbi:MAG TPA: histidine kinase dimerization/phospho-acceptor domain-containing protein [bacterium]|nr:histidine kinase dimerization/phospho-acceptor domain-containing protein [bacterium]